MLKLISGKKGSGKTKKLISMVNEAAETTSGKAVCIEKGSKLTYDIAHNVRLFNTEDYQVSGFDAFYGFLAGIAASDYDVTDVFVDSVAKITGDDAEKAVEFFDKVNSIGADGNFHVVMTVSHDENDLPDGIRKYVVANLV